MNKSELLAAMAAKSGLSQVGAGKALTAFCDVVGETLTLLNVRVVKGISKALLHHHTNRDAHTPSRSSYRSRVTVLIQC